VLDIVAGAHVPVIPFEDVVGKAGGTEPAHIGPIGLKVGVTGGVTVIGTVAVVEHPHSFVTVRLYEVEDVGHAVGFKTFVADRPVVGDQA
jgi:hypothetical protein